MIETKFTTAASTPHALVVLTADELDAVSGGGPTLSIEVPASWVIYANVATAGAVAGAAAAGGLGGLVCAAMMGADGLLNSWAESKMSNTRKSN